MPGLQVFRRIGFLLLIGMLCDFQISLSSPSKYARISGDVEVIQLTSTVWLHTTWKEIDKKRVSANGLILDTSAGPVLVDTGWTEVQTRQLIAWAKKRFNKPVYSAIITHAHEDRMGGANVLKRAAIPIYAGQATLEQTQKQNGSVQDSLSQFQKQNGSASDSLAQAKAQKWSKPDSLFTGQKVLKIGQEKIELYFPGPGHAPDNIVVWLPDQRLLFGGCLIKSKADTDLGFTGDADKRAWPAALQRVDRHCVKASIVIPGHGSWGGPDLIDHTFALLAKSITAQ